jgi:hypothetical protein
MSLRALVVPAVLVVALAGAGPAAASRASRAAARARRSTAGFQVTESPAHGVVEQAVLSHDGLWLEARGDQLGARRGAAEAGWSLSNRVVSKREARRLSRAAKAQLARERAGEAAAASGSLASRPTWLSEFPDVALDGSRHANALGGDRRSKVSVVFDRVAGTADLRPSHLRVTDRKGALLRVVDLASAPPARYAGP